MVSEGEAESRTGGTEGSGMAEIPVFWLDGHKLAHALMYTVNQTHALVTTCARDIERGRRGSFGDVSTN